MASSTIIHAACFAVGALVGGGIASAISASSAKRSIQVPTQAEPSKAPIVQIQPSTGVTGITAPDAVVKVDSTVLKHGNPGPITDLLVRKAYVAGYDRRLRHPAWVRSLVHVGSNAIYSLI
jgi:endonuclease G, mitochondrial